MATRVTDGARRRGVSRLRRSRARALLSLNLKKKRKRETALSLAKMGMFETFSSFNVMPAKLTKKKNLFDIFFITLQEHFLYG